MFHIIIGQSGAGKTTFAKTRFLDDLQPPEKDIVWITRSGIYVGLGKYGVGIRTEGTDTLPYNAKEKIFQQLLKMQRQHIVMEGDRITNDPTFQFLARIGVQVKLYLLTCSVDTSLSRLRESGSAIARKFVLASKTKSKHFIWNMLEGLMVKSLVRNSERTIYERFDCCSASR